METNRIEYKQELSAGFAKEVVPFLNYKEGGVLYLGIDKYGNVKDISDPDGTQLKIKDRLKHNIMPSPLGLFDVVCEKREEKTIIKITVASGPEKPYYLKKYGMTERGCFIRIGSASEPMPVKMIETLFSKRTRDSISKIKSNRQDLQFEQLKIYYEAAGIKLNNKFAQNLELYTPDKVYNYVTYLVSDKNSLSIKVAKYSGTTRVNLIERNEYGYNSLIKATKQVLDKIELENRTGTQITSKERQENRLWDPIALREAIINAVIHNDYSKEIPPKFELFSDRIEITSAGGLPEGLDKEEFFEGFSAPRNKELMRIFKDLDLVEQLGSGVPRIIESYDKNCFKFSENFLRMIFPVKKEVESNYDGNQDSNYDGNQDVDYNKLVELINKHNLEGFFPENVNPTEEILEKYNILAKQITQEQIQILEDSKTPKSRKEILEDNLNISNQTKNFKTHIEPLFENKLLGRTIKDKPTSKLQKYYTTPLGKVVLAVYKKIK